MSIKAIDQSDQALIQGIIQADPRQVERLYAEFLPGIVRYVTENSGSEAEARDIFQEAVIVIYKKVLSKTLELEVPLKAYLFAICRNLWLSQLRYKKSKRTTEAGEQLFDLDADTVNKMEKTQMEQLFHKHFKNLESKCRDILKSFFSKEPMKAIAERYKTSESYIKKRKHHCKSQLIKAIQSDPLYNELIT